MHIQNLTVKPAKVYVNPWKNYNDLKALKNYLKALDDLKPKINSQVYCGFKYPYYY